MPLEVDKERVVRRVPPREPLRLLRKGSQRVTPPRVMAIPRKEEEPPRATPVSTLLLKPPEWQLPRQEVPLRRTWQLQLGSQRFSDLLLPLPPACGRLFLLLRELLALRMFLPLLLRALPSRLRRRPNDRRNQTKRKIFDWPSVSLPSKWVSALRTSRARQRGRRRSDRVVVLSLPAYPHLKMCWVRGFRGCLFSRLPPAATRSFPLVELDVLNSEVPRLKLRWTMAFFGPALIFSELMRAF
jgi:hypothetical protein